MDKAGRYICKECVRCEGDFEFYCTFTCVPKMSLKYGVGGATTALAVIGACKSGWLEPDGAERLER